MLSANFLSKCLIFCQFSAFFCINNENTSSLQMVHILFRHGQRTIDPSTSYPKDPYVNETFYPYGPSELTKVGKAQMYQLGTIFRNHYDSFLGPMYLPDMIEAFSSYYNRSKVALQTVLAAMFVPSPEEMFEPGFRWQPIPFFVIEKKDDDLFLPTGDCPNFQKQVAEYTKTLDYQRNFQNDKDYFEYIYNNTGKIFYSYYEMHHIYNILTVQQELGLRLPEWAEIVYPDVLKDLLFKAYGMMTATTELTKITAGAMMKRIIDDSRGKAKNEEPYKNRKVYIYSAHDFGMVSLLSSLKIFNQEELSYGAHIIFELHKINENYGFKIYYSNETLREVNLLKIPNCQDFCLLEEFISLTKDYIPDEGTCGLQNSCNNGSLPISQSFVFLLFLSFFFHMIFLW